MARIAMIAICFCAVAASAFGAGISGTITPNAITETYNLAQTKTYTLNYNIAVSGTGGGKADILFLTDTTGSMGSYIYNVRVNFSTILAAVQAALPSMDLRYGVADYRNFTDGGNYSAYGVNLDQAFTSNTASVQSALNSLYASGGDDTPESQFKAMKTVAANWTTPSGVLGFAGRTDAQRIVIWAGDCYGHVAGDETMASGYPPGGYYPTLDSTLAALQAAGIKVFGLNLLDSTTSVGLNANYGGHPQQDFITGGTGGQSFYNVGSGGPSITNAIINSIVPGVTTLTAITLSEQGSTGAFVVTPLSQTVTGSWTTGPVTGSFTVQITAPNVAASAAEFDLALLGNGAQLDKCHVKLNTPSGDLTLNPVPLRVYLSKPYTLYVTVMGSASFDVTTINPATVKFGRTGTEASPVRAPTIADFNGDGVPDALYGFLTPACKFQLGDVKGIFKATTTGGTAVQGSVAVVVNP